MQECYPIAHEQTTYTHQPYAPGVLPVAPYYNRVMDAILEEMACRKMAEVCSIIRRFNSTPPWGEMLDTVRFNDIFIKQVPSFLAMSDSYFRAPAAPVNWSIAFTIIGLMNEAYPTELSTYLMEKKQAILEVGHTRWSHSR